MAPVLQLFGLTSDEKRTLTQAEADALYRSAYQAFVETAGAGGLRMADPDQAFTDQVMANPDKFKQMLGPKLDQALQSFRAARPRL